MRTLRVAFNGFGRIGRTAFKILWDDDQIECVAINDLTDPQTLAHLLKYDSTFGAWPHEVEATQDALLIDGVKVPLIQQKEPNLLPWGTYAVDVVLECTGRFPTQEDAQKHLVAGAKNVVISAPATHVPTLMMGVNEMSHSSAMHVVSNASCTTNSIGPVMQVLEEHFGIEKAMLTTVHAATAGQNVVDGLPSERKGDLRRARSALVNLIPTSTGAAKAVTEVLTNLEGKFDGIAIRVPVIDVSLSDTVVLLKRSVTAEEINKAFQQAAVSERYEGILGVTDEPLVSMDFLGSSYSCVVDLALTRVVDGNLIKVVAWYDNEWGYSTRLVEMAKHVGRSVYEAA